MPTHRHDPDLLVAIGQRLRAAREAAGMTQADLAEAIRIEPETLSRYEAGARGPSITVLATAARALNVRLSSLVEDEEPKERRPRKEIARVVYVLERLDDHDLVVAVRVVEAIAGDRG